MDGAIHWELTVYVWSVIIFTYHVGTSGPLTCKPCGPILVGLRSNVGVVLLPVSRHAEGKPR